MPKPVPNPNALMVDAPIWTWIPGVPEAGVTARVPRVARPAAVKVPVGRDLLISISVLLWICGLVSVYAASAALNVPHETVPPTALSAKV